jgi:peptidoglycan lytic transglycosylase
LSKSRFDVRGPGLRLGLAACMITTGIAAASPAPAGGQAEPPVTMAGSGGSDRVAYGERVSLAGRATAGAVVQLEQAPNGEGWRPISQTTAAGDGSYRFAVRARRSGEWRAVSDAGATSAPRRVTVAAKLKGRARRRVLGMRSVGVSGRLVPGMGGRNVRLEVRTRGGWKLVDRARTRAGGAYRADFRPSQPGPYRMRVRFAGDRSYAGDTNRLPRVNVYTPGAASWYGPGLYGNSTACGGTLDAGVKGVAHRWLPCGTKVRFFYRGRTTTARVIDRGPFSGSRTWDLTPATKAALGFGDVGTVWAAY